MRQILEDIHAIPRSWLEDQSGGKVLTSSDEFRLVDSGIADVAPLICAALLTRGFSLDEVRHIVLTHCQGDYTVGVAALAR